MIHLRVKDVTTEIKTNKLIENITFTMASGSIMALVGHNGAGKSTLIKTILGITEKTKGKIVIQEHLDQSNDYLEFKRHISYLPEEPLLLPELTAMQHFQLYGMSYGISEKQLEEQISHYTKGFELTDKLNAYPESLSKGMRQKVQTICALLPSTPVLLIDEPFMGLDVYAMDYLMEQIQKKASEGTSVLVSTHQLERVKHIADHFLLLQHGKLIEEGAIEAFQSIKRGSSE
ncbi:ABC transporter ATP-binding protein [Virgibacillus sp. W0181]|uniref:ABC transporter ATP-binding protein n=1 Tax=Virgibacillus sp. W0181 TaxID=3391581 RepID=UPI003F44C5EC